MPRKKKTQTPQTPGLEAGAAYGEVSDSLAAQDPNKGGIPLPIGSAQIQAGPPVEPEPLPIDVAQQFPNTVTPLTAPGQGMTRPSNPLRITNEMRAATLLKEWAANSGDPIVKDAAMQMEVYLRNG
jgi:hypothetical protein|tara:strand:- start:928 stop:1305 length:378 start_codon:yes stop_codon:yes gene_type:complete